MGQNDIVEALIANGSALAYLKELSYASVRDNYFQAINRAVFLDGDEDLDSYLKFDVAASLLIMIRLEEDTSNVIPYKYKEGGSLIRGWKDEGIIHADVLVEEAGKMKLNSSQLVELEALLNKADRTLNISLPDIPEPTEQEKYRAISHLTGADIHAKPRRHYEIFLNDMIVAGTPVKMSAKQFREYAEKVLNPS